MAPACIQLSAIETEKIMINEIQIRTAKTSRKSLIQTYIETLENERDVPLNTMKSALTPTEWRGFRATLKIMPPRPIDRKSAQDFGDYNRRLRTADLLYGRAEGTRVRKRKTLHHAAEQAYERALESLQELLGDQPGLQIFLDRAVSFDMDDAPSPDPDGVPRVVSSKSIYARHNLNREEDMRHLMIETLRASLHCLIE
jgi:hypothetical protein